MPDSHCPTKTLSVRGDIWPDQPDIPAFGLASGPPVAAICRRRRLVLSVARRSHWSRAKECVCVCVCV